MNLIRLAALGLLLCCGTSHADEDERPAPQTLEELETAIREVMDERDVPAVGIAMVDESGPVWVTSLGVANVEEDVAADERTLYRIGSTSKMFVALSVLKLVEEGALSLDDRLADLAPEIEYENRWEDSDPVLLAHLLEHTTGWDDIHLPEYAHNDPTPVSLKEGLDFHPHSRISRWKPGSRMSYCNAGPPIAAYIVEKTTGRDFEDYVQENFFDPIGMQTATYRLNDDVRERGATLYMAGEPQDYWHISMRPSGSINASPLDMAQFASFFVNRGTVDGVPLVSGASLQRMETAATTSAARAGQEIGYGLNNYSSRHENWIYREHNGGVNGGLTEFSYLPKAGAGHALMINSGNGAAINEISDLVRDYETRNLEAPPAPEPAAIGPGHESIAGLYLPINPRAEMSRFLDRVFGIQQLYFDDERLVVKPLLDSETFEYVAASEDLYRSLETGAISLTRVQDPLVGTAVHWGTLVLKPVSPLVAYGQLAIGALWGIAILTSILYALVWSVRRLRGKIQPGAAMRVRVWPLLASLSIIGFVVTFSIGMRNPFETLGEPTLLSLSIMLTSVLFAVFAIAGTWTAWNYRDAEMNRVNYWHSAASSATHLLVAMYFAWFGVIGIMTWA